MKYLEKINKTMNNLELINQKLYKKEKRKLTIKIFSLNFIIIGILLISLSNTQTTITNELELLKLNYNKKLNDIHILISQRDSLKDFILTDLDSLKKNT